MGDTDRELLELAAKAAGIPWVEGGPSRMGWAGWNPLTDDGDALRLAVKLNIDAGKPGMRLSVDWREGEDPYAATRRAIVRAAAAIGATHE